MVKMIPTTMSTLTRLTVQPSCAPCISPNSVPLITIEGVTPNERANNGYKYPRNRVSSTNGATSTAMAMNNKAVERYLKSSSTGIWSGVFMREVRAATSKERTQPQKKNKNAWRGLPFAAARILRQPRHSQKGWPRSSESVTYRKKKTTAYQTSMLPMANSGLESKYCSICLGVSF